MTAAARRDYLTAYRLHRLGARVPLRTDARAPLAVWAAACAAPDARRTDPLSVPLRTRLRALALAQGLGVGRLVTLQRLPLPLDLIPPAAGPAAPPPAGLPAPATAQAHPPAQPDPQDPTPELIPCDVCAGTGRVRVCSFAFDSPDEFDFCESCGGFGFTEVDLSEPDPSIAKTLALSLAECVRVIDDFYHCPVSSDVDLHAALKAACQRARATLNETGYSLSRWPF
ncbi:hypothetical protein [Plasticicumulans sp.]|uniref:hypothetical protein n=1 Tax=Plasticicumulans sp. TaxID=2307179 RepID=UPI0032209968